MSSAVSGSRPQPRSTPAPASAAGMDTKYGVTITGPTAVTGGSGVSSLSASAVASALAAGTSGGGNSNSGRSNPTASPAGVNDSTASAAQSQASPAPQQQQTPSQAQAAAAAAQQSAAVTSRLTEQQIAEIKDVFSLFDKDSDGWVDVVHLGLMMRGLGQAPSDAEIKQWELDVDRSGNGSFEFADFLELMAVTSREPDTADALENAFLVFNRVGEDNIQLNELETIMTRMGEPLTPEEMKQLIAQATDDDGTGSTATGADNSVNYEKLVKRMLSSYNR